MNFNLHIFLESILIPYFFRRDSWLRFTLCTVQIVHLIKTYEIKNVFERNTLSFFFPSLSVLKLKKKNCTFDSRGWLAVMEVDGSLGSFEACCFNSKKEYFVDREISFNSEILVRFELFCCCCCCCFVKIYSTSKLLYF